jgi:HNH endonuclease
MTLSYPSQGQMRIGQNGHKTHFPSHFPTRETNPIQPARAVSKTPNTVTTMDTHTPTICKVPTCGRKTEIARDQLCRLHYKRKWKSSYNEPCVGPHCIRLARYRKTQLCEAHQEQVLLGIELKPLVDSPSRVALVDRDTSLLFLQEQTVRDKECWLWSAGLNDSGYGTITAGYKDVKHNLAHRLMYHIYNDEDPGKLSVHHTCANRACINPEHLQLLTARENTAEMLERKAYRLEIASLKEKVRELQQGGSLGSLYFKDTDGTLTPVSRLINEYAVQNSVSIVKVEVDSCISPVGSEQ